MAVSYEFGRDAYNQWQAYNEHSMCEIVEQWLLLHYSQSIQNDYSTLVSMTESDYANERQQVLDNEDGFDDTLVLGRLCEEFEAFFDILQTAKADKISITKDEFDEYLYNEWLEYNKD